jgi:F-type H+-transporting ATPase subunit gamma
MSQAREIRSKIASINNTQKITRAMELVAASKMRKAQDRMSASHPYSEKIRKVIRHVASSHAEYKHPYLQERNEIKRVGYIIVTTDRGLCGGLNINLLRKTVKELKAWHEKDVEVELCLIGKKGESFFKSAGGNVVAMTDHLGDAPDVHDLIGIVKVMLDHFDKGQLDAIYIASNDFINTMVQKPTIRQLLPLPKEEEGDVSGHWDYLYEPDSAKDLLTKLLIRYIESQVYQSAVENIACEQSARMVAMKSATENAGELIRELQLIYNKARQAGITREIAEIVAGAAAVE